MASLERRGDGWRVRWRALDGKSCSRQCPDRRTAEELAGDIARAHALGREWAPAAAPAAPPRVVDALQAWIDDRARWQSPRAVRRMASELDVWIRWCEGEGIETVAQLSRDVLSRYHAYLQTERTEVHPATETARAWTRTVSCSPRTANGRVVDLQTWWAWLADHDDYGPVTPPPRRIALPIAHPALQPVAPTWADMDATIAQAKTEWHRRAAWIMRCSGLRPGQVVRLRWADVDLQACTLRVRPELGKSPQERRGRVVPMAPVLQREIATWPRPTDPRTSLTGGPLAWDYDPWRGMWTRAGVAPERWSRQPCHCWRKGFSSGLRALGASKDAVERLTGHAVGVSETYVTGEAAGLADAVALVPVVKLGRVRPVPETAEGTDR